MDIDFWKNLEVGLFPIDRILPRPQEYQPGKHENELDGVGGDPWGGTRIGLTGEAEISRKAFGLEWNAALEAGGVLVGDNVKLQLDVEAVKQA